MEGRVQKSDKNHYFLDITSEVCPFTFIKTKLLLERISIGEEISVRLKGDEPLRNVPRSVEELGHRIISCVPDPLSSAEEKVHILVIRKS